MDRRTCRQSKEHRGIRREKFPPVARPSYLSPRVGRSRDLPLRAEHHIAVQSGASPWKTAFRRLSPRGRGSTLRLSKGSGQMRWNFRVPHTLRQNLRPMPSVPLTPGTIHLIASRALHREIDQSATCKSGLAARERLPLNEPTPKPPDSRSGAWRGLEKKSQSTVQHSTWPVLSELLEVASP